MFIVVVGGVYFLVQCGLAVLCWWFLPHVTRAIKPRESSEPLAGAGGWPGWVESAFDAREASSPGWTRDDAFEMLDERIAAYQGYQWLQRLGVMAPLLGVLITAIGLSKLDVPANKPLTISSILTVIAPLFSGVITGALLAITNQILLQLVQWHVEDVRAHARDWFDRTVWPRVNAGPREAVNATVKALGDYAESVRKSSRVQQANARRTRRATRAVARSMLASEKAFQGFGTGLTGFSTELSRLQKVTETTRSLAESMEPSLHQVHETLKTSVTAFHEAVVGRFVPAATKHDEASKFARDASAKTTVILAKFETLTQELLEQIKLLSGGTRGLGETGEALRLSIHKSLLPANDSLLQASVVLNQSAQAVPGQFETSSAAFASTAERLLQAIKKDLAPAATDLHTSISEVLRPTIDRQQAITAEAGRVFDGLKTLFDEIQDASRSLEERYRRLSEAANRQTLAGEEVMQSWKGRLLPAQEALAGSVAELAGSSKKLSEFVDQGLQPATDGLAELGRIIPRVREAAEAIGTIGTLNTELRELLSIAERLHQAVDSARSLAELEGVIGQMSKGFEKADELRQTISEMPDLFARQLHEMSNDAFRRQAGDLKETLYDIVKQFGWQAPEAVGKAETSR